MIELELDGRTIRFDDAGIDREAPDGIYGSLLKGAFYEYSFLAYVRSLQVQGVYLDVGAYVGTHSVFFAEFCPSTRVHAFEAQRVFHERLVTNLSLNGLDEVVVAHRVALSDRRRGSTTLTFDDETSTVPLARIDDLVHEPVALIKIDVEGMEPAVLAGARRVIRRGRPVVFAEARTADEYVDMTRELRRLGYRWSGKVFNATPTYEFVAVPWQHRALHSPWGRRVRAAVPAPLGRLLGRLLGPVLGRLLPAAPEHVADR